MSRPFVAVLMGSDSDLPIMEEALGILDHFGIATELRILSAHRTPEATHTYVKEADARGCAIFIAAAGLAAHLAGTVAALTLKPVIGVPMEGGPLHGIDALLSTVQMPGGVPVACMAIGKAGAKNAAYLATQILALQDPVLAEGLQADRAETVKSILGKQAALAERYTQKPV